MRVGVPSWFIPHAHTPKSHQPRSGRTLDGHLGTKCKAPDRANAVALQNMQLRKRSPFNVALACNAESSSACRQPPGVAAIRVLVVCQPMHSSPRQASASQHSGGLHATRGANAIDRCAHATRDVARRGTGVCAPRAHTQAERPVVTVFRMALYSIHRRGKLRIPAIYDIY